VPSPFNAHEAVSAPKTIDNDLWNTDMRKTSGTPLPGGFYLSVVTPFRSIVRHNGAYEITALPPVFLLVRYILDNILHPTVQELAELMDRIC
jgi:hypothetical protein